MASYITFVFWDAINAVLEKGSFRLENIIWATQHHTPSRVSPVIFASKTGKLGSEPLRTLWLSGENCPCDSSLEEVRVWGRHECRAQLNAHELLDDDLVHVRVSAAELAQISIGTT